MKQEKKSGIETRIEKKRREGRGFVVSQNPAVRRRRGGPESHSPCLSYLLSFASVL